MFEVTGHQFNNCNRPCSLGEAAAPCHHRDAVGALHSVRGGKDRQSLGPTVVSVDSMD